jgi:hypothetical protein
MDRHTKLLEHHTELLERILHALSSTVGSSAVESVTPSVTRP